MKTAVIFGGSGLVGSHCLKQLLENSVYKKVIAFGRRPLGMFHPKLEEKIIDFEKFDSFKDSIQGDEVFFCMGTTISQAGTREAFRRVDFEYPLQIARAALSNGASKWLMITSIGSSADSPFFYLRVKGELERELVKLGFKACHIFRPSFLLGKRPNKRFLEDLFIPIAQAIAPLMQGPLKKMRPVEVTFVARRMLAAAQSQSLGSSIHYL